MPSWARQAAIKELNRRGIDWPPKAQRATAADPVAFAADELGVSLWQRQEEICRAVAAHPRVTVRSCHNSGKTFLAAVLTHWWVRHYEPSLVLTTAPTARQVEGVLWNQIRRLGAGLPGKLSSVALSVSPSQRALGLSTNEPERFQGWHEANILVIVDEASGVEPAIYEAIEGCLTGPNARLLLIGNPNSPSGAFYDSFGSGLYQHFHISAPDVPETLLPAAWREERLREWGPESPAYQVRVLGEFPEQGDDSLISLRWVTEAQERDSCAGDDRVLGCDIARFGGDESGVYVRIGGNVVAGHFWRGADTLASAGRIAALAREHALRVIHVDEIGVGAGVVDALRAEFRGERVTVSGINVGESASDSEHFANRRSEIFWGLRERFKAGEIRITKDDHLLVGQLTALKFSYTPRGQIKLMSKEDMRKERAGHHEWQSPDRADALALAFCLPTGSRPVAMVGKPRAR